MIYLCKSTPNNITSLRHNEVFVFGSNLAGIHGKGAAALAYKKFGAVRGVGIGMQGKSYAIPTKDCHLKPLSLDTISWYVNSFIEFIKNHQELEFLVTRVGCGLAGYKDSDIAPLFRGCFHYRNVSLPQKWLDILPQWGNELAEEFNAKSCHAGPEDIYNMYASPFFQEVYFYSPPIILQCKV